MTNYYVLYSTKTGTNIFGCSSVKEARRFAMDKLRQGMPLDNIGITDLGYVPCVVIGTHVPPGRGDPVIVKVGSQFYTSSGPFPMRLSKMRQVYPDGSIERRS